LLFTWRREARPAERTAGAAAAAALTFALIKVIPDQGAPSCARPESRIVIELPQRRHPTPEVVAGLGYPIPTARPGSAQGVVEIG
jgi:hypothetical protein